MSAPEFIEHAIDKVSLPPLVHDCTHPDESDDDAGAEGALVALAGPPVDGGVPTYDVGTGKHTSQVPTGGLSLDASTLAGRGSASGTGAAEEITLGTGLAMSGTTLSADPSPSSNVYVWMPLTTVVGGVPELVWDGDNSLIPTLVPL